MGMVTVVRREIEMTWREKTVMRSLESYEGAEKAFLHERTLDSVPLSVPKSLR